MGCVYCRQEPHTAWCPAPLAEKEGQDLAQPLATEYWARAALAAAGITDPSMEQRGALGAMCVALHRYANAEGLALARRHIPNHEDYKEDELHPLLRSISENVAGAHAEALHVGVELPVGQAQASAPVAKKV